MKRILALLLSVVTVLSLFSCALENALDTSDIETIEVVDTTTEKKAKKKLENTNIQEQLDAIPIAKQGMSEMELRQICVDFFNLMASFPWTPSERFFHKGLNLPREKGGPYGGIPYISKASGNLYRAMEFYNSENGLLDVSEFVGHGEYFGNACSGGASWSWFRVVNSFNSSDGAWTQNFTHLNGALRVGPYTYKDVQNFHSASSKSKAKYTPQNVIEENDEQTIYESYALTKIADGVVHPGHVRMVSIAPTVVRNADGTINPDESWLGCTEQIKYVNAEDNKFTQENGLSYNRQGFVNKKYTFTELYKKYYIPFTFAEFLGTDPVEDGSATLEGVEGNSISHATLTATKVVTNYALSDVFITITAPDGTEEWKTVRRSRYHYYYSMKGETCFDEETLKVLEPFAEKGDRTITLTCQIGNGEKLVAYSGILTK